MDVYLLYFTLHGHDPNGFTSWGAIVVEDGEMESFVGSGPTEFESLLDGLVKCLEQLPSTLPIVIRSKSRPVLQLGKRWIDTWRSDGWESELHGDLVENFMNIVESRRVEWFCPNYLDHLDKTVAEYALEEWNFQQDSIAIDEASDDRGVHETPTDPEELHADIDTAPTPDIVNTAIELNTGSETEVEDAVESESESEESSRETDTHVDNEPLSEIESVQSSIEASSPTQELVKVPPEIQIDPDDQEQYPYVDDDGWKQFYTLFDPPFNTVEQQPPSRIVAYVAASHHQDLAAWSFALIDRPSQIAFFKAVGHRHSTLNRALLQGCIALLTTLKSSSHHVECRLDNADLTTLLQRLIADPHAYIEDDIWMMESAFVSQLSYWIEQRSLTVEYIGEDTDLARQMVQNFSRERLDALNYGEAAEFSLRRTRFPLERLKN